MNTEHQAISAEANQPSDAIERTLAALWQEVLQMPGLPNAMDDFFALGGDSMTMVLLEYRIQEELCVELPSGSLLGAPTLGELAAVVDRFHISNGRHPGRAEC